MTLSPLSPGRMPGMMTPAPAATRKRGAWMQTPMSPQAAGLLKGNSAKKEIE
jgi:hypothetical protein